MLARCTHSTTYTFPTFLNDGTPYGFTEVEPSCDDGGCSFVAGLPRPFDDVDDVQYHIEWELEQVIIDVDHVCKDGTAWPVYDNMPGRCAECATAGEWEAYEYNATHGYPPSPMHDPDAAREESMIRNRY